MVVQHDRPCISGYSLAPVDAALCEEEECKDIVTAERNAETCKFRVCFLPQSPSTSPKTIQLATRIGTWIHGVHLQRIRLGDNFVCAGQSNMEMALKDTLPRVKDLGPAYISMMQVPVHDGQTGNLQKPNKWISLHPKPTAFIQEFSAVCWHFGWNLYQKLNPDGLHRHPIGLIQFACSSTMINQYMSPDSLAQCPRALRRCEVFPSYHAPIPYNVLCSCCQPTSVMLVPILILFPFPRCLRDRMAARCTGTRWIRGS